MVFSSTTWILSLKVVLISIGVFYLAQLLKVSAPVVLDFSVSQASQAPHLWSTLLSWLKPPYLYFVINAIIITIAASSWCHHTHDHQTEQIPPSKTPTDSTPEFDYEMKNRSNFGDMGSRMVDRQETEENEEAEARVIEEKSIVISRSTWTPTRRCDSWEIPSGNLFPGGKPLVSTRFGHRKPVKSIPEGGRALRRVSKPKRHETLEQTWKTITEGRAMPLKRHLKKFDTWENNDRQIIVDPYLVKKSGTVKVRPNQSRPPVTSRKLKAEPLLSRDELNRRVEAFINKFNGEMRLQRQESLNRYSEMIDRGSS